MKIAPRYRGSVIWMLRPFGSKTTNGYVKVQKSGRVLIHLDRTVAGAFEDTGYMELDRRTARLLAKRILQALEETR